MTLLLETETHAPEVAAPTALPTAETARDFKLAWSFCPEGTFQGARWTF